MVGISDERALEIFSELRAQAFSHKSSNGQTSCEYRSAKVADALQGTYGISDVKKIWIYGENKEGELCVSSLKWPVRLWGDMENDKQGDEPILYNFHTAPLIVTDSGRSLVFDTHIYENPPEFEQWISDFLPADKDVKIKTLIMDADHMFLDRDLLHLREKKYPETIQRVVDGLRVSFNLWTAESQPTRQDDLLRSVWLKERVNEPHPLKSDYSILSL